MPDERIDLGQPDPCLDRVGVAAVVEQAQLHLVGDFGEQRKVGACAVVGRTQRVGGAGPRPGAREWPSVPEHCYALTCAGTPSRTCPRTSPSPTVVPSGPGAVAVIDTSSPSARKLRVPPSLRVNGDAPSQLSSSSEPRWSGATP